ncbi:hypothetical protein KIL84_010292 [Mauremys mutica]|uniref:Uncharacterized protein n=1 Tax=Mauremys mutica TaxID=74926 RepID=A0A9D3XC96_9SAUR|nr:hypothetical protein KIL84_010292 [Mauremys mutica]
MVTNLIRRQRGSQFQSSGPLTENLIEADDTTSLEAQGHVLSLTAPKGEEAVGGKSLTLLSLRWIDACRGKCVLCQEDTSSELINPVESKREQAGSGYQTVAENIRHLHMLNERPVYTDICRAGDGDGIEKTLNKNNGHQHKSCYIKFNRTKLKKSEEKENQRKLWITLMNCRGSTRG